MGQIALEELLDSGVAMLGAFADPDLVPECFRVWGAVHDGASDRLRMMVNADATRTLEGVREGSRLSVTLTDILSFRSLQLKGAAMGPPTMPSPADLVVMRRYTDDFIAKLLALGHPALLGERLRPTASFVLEMSIDDRFDQTPGRDAGAPVAR